MNYHLEVKEPENVSKMEDEFAMVIESRGAEFQFYQDQYGEHPDERAAANEIHKEKLEKVQTVSSIFQDLKAKVPAHSL